MVKRYVLIGVVAGLFASFVALITGVSFWSMLVLYSGVGGFALITVPIAQFVFVRLLGWPSMRVVSGQADIAFQRQSLKANVAHLVAHLRLSEQDRETSTRVVSDQADIVLHRQSLKANVAHLVGHLRLSERDRQTSMKILAVDDDPSLLELIPMIAEEADFPDVTTVSSGALALDTIAEADPVFDCILLDISMPDMDGIELCARIRELSAYRQTPIIMLTAMREMKYLQRAFEAGATDYVTKPFDVINFGSRLRAAQDDVIAHQQTPAREGPIWEEFGLEDASSSRGIAGFVEYTALENYLNRISRKNLERVNVLGIKVDQIETIESLASSEMRADIMKKTANAIAEVFRTNETLLSYAGNGIFMIVSGAEDVRPVDSAEAEIQNLLRARRFEGKNGDPLEITVSVGSPIRPDAGGKAKLAETTFNRAIFYAETRKLGKQGETRSPGIRLMGR